MCPGSRARPGGPRLAGLRRRGSWLGAGRCDGDRGCRTPRLAGNSFSRRQRRGRNGATRTHHKERRPGSRPSAFVEGGSCGKARAARTTADGLPAAQLVVRGCRRSSAAGSDRMGTPRSAVGARDPLRQQRRARAGRGAGDPRSVHSHPERGRPAAFPPANDAARLAARSRLALGEEPIVVCTGRLCHQKGQDRLVEAGRPSALE